MCLANPASAPVAVVYNISTKWLDAGEQLRNPETQRSPLLNEEPRRNLFHLALRGPNSNELYVRY